MENQDQTQIPETTVPTTEPQSTNKKRQGIFPRLPLKSTLELPRAIYAVGQGEPVRRLMVFDRLGKSAGSGLSRMLIIVSGIYGLTNGGYQAEYLELTDTGKKIVQSESLESIYEVLFKNDIFSQFMEYWKDKTFPMDDIASDWLVRTLRLNPDDAKSFWGVIKENIRDYRLTQQLSGKEVIVSKEVALQSQGEVISPTEASVSPLDMSAKALTSLPMNEKVATTVALPKGVVEIELENEGVVRIIVANKGEITKMDVKQMKAQIDIFSKFIDQDGK